MESQNEIKKVENTEEVVLNVNAKSYVPKTKTENLPLNLNAEEYVLPNNKTEKAEDLEIDDDEDEDEVLHNEKVEEQFDMIVKDIIKNDVWEKIGEEEESEDDDEKWFPKYRDCECCKGFVYKCSGVACLNLGKCYCKIKAECDDE